MACDAELNRQLQGLQARISKLEDDGHAMYLGVSAMCQSLAQVPGWLESTFGGALTAIYNGVPNGMFLLKSFVEKLFPGIMQAMKQLSIMIAMALIDAIIAEIEMLIIMGIQEIDKIVDKIDAEITAVLDEMQDISDQLASLADISELRLPLQLKLDILNIKLDALHKQRDAFSKNNQTKFDAETFKANLQKALAAKVPFLSSSVFLLLMSQFKIATCGQTSLHLQP